MGPQARAGDVGLAAPAVERALVPVQPDVELQVDVLGEPAGAELARERLVARVEPLVGLQVGRRAELPVALAALVRALTLHLKMQCNPCVMYKVCLQYLSLVAPSFTRCDFFKRGRKSVRGSEAKISISYM